MQESSSITVERSLREIDGLHIGTAKAGIKQQERDDLTVFAFDADVKTAAVFTRNAFQAAPVVLARENLANATEVRALVINSGNANAGTGELGMQNATAICQAVAEQLGINRNQVLPFSTGVIGEQLPLEKILQAIPNATAQLASDAWPAAAQAILTTDTCIKTASASFVLNGESCTITGISKGSGMIHPNMATMLAFIATDATISQSELDSALQETVKTTFNAITVDGDTSTNDACVLVATGANKKATLSNAEDQQQFQAALHAICAALAEQIVRDGEGATKLIRIEVEQAQDIAEAQLVGKTIAGSPLVKTAFFASDPNWGRILAAIGRVPLPHFEISNISFYLNTVCVIKDGLPTADYTEAAGQQAMSEQEITVRVQLGRGDSSATTLSCDLSYDYVRINAEYRS